MSVGCLACCKHGARNISSIISSILTPTLGVWCHDPHFTDGDAESESNCSFHSPCCLSTRWQKMQFQNQFDLQTFRVPIIWGFLEKSHQFFMMQLPLQASQYCIPEQWLVSIVCHFLDDRVSFYVPCTMFCLVVLMPNVDKAAVDSVYHLVASSTENLNNPFGSYKWQ